MLIFARNQYEVWSWELRDGDEPLGHMSGFASKRDAVDGIRRFFNVLGAEHEMEEAIKAALKAAAPF